jgi:cytochrome P450
MFGLLLAAFMLSASAQAQSWLSPEDQREFDKYYTKWVNDTRKNDRDDIAKDVGRMQEIMGRNHISADVPFDQLASTGNAYGARVYQGRLSADEQRDFDKYYTKWVNDTRKNDRDDIAKDVRHMQEIMARKNIPANVPFD